MKNPIVSNLIGDGSSYDLYLEIEFVSDLKIVLVALVLMIGECSSLDRLLGLVLL